jgi:hypothetical protein
VGGALLLMVLAGCAQYYWTKPGGTAEQFTADSGECAREAVPAAPAPGENMLVTERYRACLTARGYTRATQLDPPPAGWYRGIE